jgi:hypothetical protein
MTDSIITDYDIQALVDNQLSWEEEKLVRQHILASSQAKERYDELIRQRKVLQHWWQKSNISH